MYSASAGESRYPRRQILLGIKYLSLDAIYRVRAPERASAHRLQSDVTTARPHIKNDETATTTEEEERLAIAIQSKSFFFLANAPRSRFIASLPPWRVQEARLVSSTMFDGGHKLRRGSTLPCNLVAPMALEKSDRGSESRERRKRDATRL